MPKCPIVNPQLIHRPVLWAQPRVYCLHCRYSVPVGRDDADSMGAHLGSHRGAGAIEGVDWQLGTRYGPAADAPRGGAIEAVEALRTRHSTPGSRAPGRSLEAALRRLLARGPMTRGVLLHRLWNWRPLRERAAALEAALAAGWIRAEAVRPAKGPPTTRISLAGNRPAGSAV